MASRLTHENHVRGRDAAGNDDSAMADDDFELLLEYPETVDYYSILGLSRDPPPTDSQLRAAYHNLTLSFHPDKQPRHLVEAAKAQFNRILEAYETLIDPKKRIVYDLQGEQAVKQEWSAGGLMGGRAGQKATNDEHTAGPIGPRAMSPSEFRQYFIERMKMKERTVLSSMVGAKGSITVGIDASSLVSADEEEGYVELNIPTMRVSQYAIAYSFSTALPNIKGLWSSPDDEPDVGDQLPDQKSETQEETDVSSPTLTFEAAVGGAVKRKMGRMRVAEEDGTEHTVQVLGPHKVSQANLNLSTNISHSITGLGLRAGSHSKLWSWLEGATVNGNAQIFPTRALAVTISKQVAPFPHAKPMTVAVSCTVPPHPKQSMPMWEISLVRPFGSRKFGSIAYSSGTMPWPRFVRGLLSPFVDMTVDLSKPFVPFFQPSSIQLKYATVPDAMTAEEAEAAEFEMRTSLTKKEVWQCLVSASPVGSSLTLHYGRTFFADRVEDPPRSEWNLDGYHPLASPQSFRGVRVESQATVSLMGDMTWSITSLRRVGTFSSIGLSIGVADGRGLLMSFIWRRLGQSIKVPVAICPLDLVNMELSLWAVMVPWLTYVGIEFSYLRPRERRRRRQAIIRRRKRLRSQIPMRRAESAQQVEMMTEQVQRRRERERAKGGLVIERAEYGYIPTAKTKKRTKDDADLVEPKLVDVTIAVASLVDKSQLVISKNTIRFQIIGFYDPAPLLPKTLKIWYTFGGQQHYLEANDDEDILCPRREDLIGVVDI